jgi:hypothetical protein
MYTSAAKTDCPKTGAKQMNYKTYEVTITPKETIYSGSWVSREYTVEVYAKSASAAITAARQERLDQEGRYAPKVSYKAKVAI